MRMTADSATALEKSHFCDTKSQGGSADLKSGRFVYQSGRAGDEAKKRKSPSKIGRFDIYGNHTYYLVNDLNATAENKH